MRHKADHNLARTPLNNAAKAQMAHISRPGLEVACDALVTGNLQYFVDQCAADVKSLPRFEQDRADAYNELVKRLPESKIVTRDEIYTLLNYVIGDLPSAPEKFGTILKRNRVHLRSVRRGDKVARGITVEWKTCTS
jgi:hypothetical protein